MTDENFRDYVQLPDVVLRKYQSGAITKTHFSDILRFNLLADHGGVWVDATVMTLGDVARFFDLPLFTLKTRVYPPEDGISYGQWTGYCFKCRAAYPPARLVKDCLNAYWRTHDALVAYFLIDHTLRFAYRKSPAFRRDIDALGYYGDNRFLLVDLLDAEADETGRRRIEADPVKIYKLTFKRAFRRRTPGGAPTFYDAYVAPAP